MRSSLHIVALMLSLWAWTAAPAAASGGGGGRQSDIANPNFDPTEKGGKHNRRKLDYRHPDELTRVEVLGHAIATLTANGVIASAPTTAEFIADQLGQAPQQAAAEPAQQAPEPTPEARAAEAASTQPGPAESASDPLAAWISGL